MPENLAEYNRVQTKAKRVLEKISSYISATRTERQIAEKCVSLLAEEGVHETWYYEAPALVLLGSRSCLSISGRDYVPSNEVVGVTNLVTIDLSPMLDGYWGDCAHSFFVEDGVVATDPLTKEFSDGKLAQSNLHNYFLQIAKPEMTFEQVWSEINALIDEIGYRNLDFMGNVGHSIVKTREERVYFEKGNSSYLGDVEFFTFEPHVSTDSRKWGFKHENIHYFDSAGKIRVL